MIFEPFLKIKANQYTEQQPVVILKI